MHLILGASGPALDLAVARPRRRPRLALVRPPQRRARAGSGRIELTLLLAALLALSFAMSP